MTEDHDLTVELRHVNKSFGGVAAVTDATFAVRPGEVLGLVGENGAGKSTLLGTFSGRVNPDSGEVLIRGHEQRSLTPALAKAAGVALVQQELAASPELTVAETMGLNVRFARRGPFIRWRSLRQWAQRLLDDWDLGISADQRMKTLTPPQQVAINVAMATVVNAHTIVLDEPTASFSPPEVERLLALVRRLRDQGIAIIYVTHRLDEVFAVCDRVTVMRSGEIVATKDIGEVDRAGLVELIVGRALEFRTSGVPLEGAGDLAIEVQEIADSRVGPVSFSARYGEILGFAGLVGAGRTELFELIYGLRSPDSGQVRVDGTPHAIRSPIGATRLGMGLVPEERRRSALIPRMSVLENALLPVLERYHPLARRRRSRVKDMKQIADTTNLKAASWSMPVISLSGGNQQKVVIGRWLNAGARILLLDEPTRGVDIGAKEEIYELIRAAARDGACVLVASSEHEELVEICNRVLVMREGAVVDEVVGSAIDARTIARLCFGT
ncbi:MAG TPA: sugar ABC transporter ATP-binding protein [Pseudolysinimonas sp.]|nr:sugar ABC transporter ATP-binding protein [Pseudolysinimonas sp.]